MRNMNFEEHNDLCVGIDLGTTNSVLATINEKANGDIVSKVVEISRSVDMYNAVSGEPKLTMLKKPTLPSCIYYRQEKNYEPLVGDFAKMQYPLRPYLTAKSIKSQMGKPYAQGLLSDVPDRTPAEISARILKHMLKETSKVYRCEITDAVITVPANFDSAMCRATRDAAELAGIKVRNADGKERPVLLSEPNAVIYDLINQIHNGEIAKQILDLREKKRVLVFDLGGGTLDITMHELSRREDCPDVLKVDEIAANRYTLLGGDDFDEEIAKEMFARYLKQYEKYPEVVLKLKKEESIIMPQLRVYAEHVKLELNERCGDTYSSGWDDEESDEIEILTGGNMGGIGYSYDDTFTKDEIEQILSVFLADELNYFDYKRIETIKNTGNIIYPILDVLKKASEKLDEEDVRVDAVLVNGGMSKFYMITERLTQFFGFEPVAALDPDQAVARGAAVYHYYLHKYEKMQDDMRMLGESDSVFHVNNSIWNGSTKRKNNEEERAAAPVMAIQWGKNILNDSLYLGMKNGAVHKIIPTGAELPYQSPLMTGFRVEAGQNRIAVPIKSRNIDGTYRKIASGNIMFRQCYKDGAFVAFQIYMESSKVITMRAWTCKDEAGIQKIEEGCAEIAIDNRETTKMKTKIIPPSGSILNPREEISNMLQLCKNLQNCKKKDKKADISKKITACVSNISNAGNREAFAKSILDALDNTLDEEARNRLFILARKIGTTWNDSQKQRLADFCMSQIGADLQGYSIGGPRVSTNIQAVYTLSICADEQQLNRLAPLHDTTRYLQACLYTHARTKTALNWLQEEFENDVEKVKKHYRSNIQFSAYAIGIAMQKDENLILPVMRRAGVVNKLCYAVESGALANEELTCCLLALGYLCDQRNSETDLDSRLIHRALDAVRNMGVYYPVLIAMKQKKVQEVAVKMINGDLLSEDEEEFLLTKLEK